MSVYFWIAILFVWIAGLAVAFIFGMTKDIKERDDIPPETKKAEIKRLLCLLVFNIVITVLIHLGSKYLGQWFDNVIIGVAVVIIAAVSIFAVIRKRRK